MFSKKWATLLLLCMSLPLWAQSEGGLLLEAEAEKKLSKKFSIGLDADMRTRNDFRTMDRWGVGVGGEFKIIKYLKVDAGYRFLIYNMREKISYKQSGAYNHWRPSYWGVKHRFYASVMGSYKFPFNLKISLRERWQLTCRPEKTVTRWDFDNEAWEDKVRSSRSTHLLRSRLEVSYDKKRALFTPYTSVELFNGWALSKIRYTAGTDIRLTKMHSLSVFYRFQKIYNAEEDEYDPDMHYAGVGYKFEF